MIDWVNTHTQRADEVLDYCNTNTQCAYGSCDIGGGGDQPTDPTEPVEGRCGPDFGDVKCSNNECCSQAGTSPASFTFPRIMQHSS